MNTSGPRRVRKVAIAALMALGVIAPASARSGDGKTYTSHRERIAARDVVSFSPLVRVDAGNVGVPHRGKAATPAGTTPSVSTGFGGPTGDGITKTPDASGAVGRDRIMTATNTEVRVCTRAGATVLSQSLSAWWAGLGATAVSRPRVLFDPYGSRWIFTAVDPTTAMSSILLAVSDSADATGTWHRYRIAASPSTLVFADAPQPGFSAGWIAVQQNAYTATGTFVLSRVFAFPRADLYGADISSVAAIDLVGVGGFQQPAATYDGGLGSLHLLQARTDGLERFVLSGSAGAPSIIDAGAIDSPLPYSFTGPGAPQPGTSDRVDLGDSNLHSVVYRNGSLWTAHTVFLPAGAPTYSAIQWWQVSASTGAVEQHGRIQWDDDFEGYPSIAVNSGSDALIGFSRFSASRFPAAGFSYRNGGDPINTTQIVTTFKQGEASYVNKDASGANPWGGYSAAVVDPFNDQDLWTLQEYASTPAGGLDRWGTWWSRIAPTTAPVMTLDPVSLDFASSVVGNTSAARSITITNSGNVDLLLGRAAIGGPQAPEFGIAADSCSGATVAQGESCRIAVTFTPAARGGRGATLSISSNAASSPGVVGMIGTGVVMVSAPHVSIQPTSIDFGNVDVGTTSEPRTLRVINDGTAPLLASGVDVEGSKEFTVVTDGCTGRTVSPRQFCSVAIALTPATLGLHYASFIVYGNMPGGATRANLFGNGVDQTPPSSSYTGSQNGDVRTGILLAGYDSYNTMAGVSTDAVSGVRSVEVRFDGLLLSQSVRPALDCNATRTSCAWSVPVPAVPGLYTVTVRATDRAGNVEAGESITIFDL